MYNYTTSFLFPFSNRIWMVKEKNDLEDDFIIGKYKEVKGRIKDKYEGVASKVDSAVLWIEKNPLKSVIISFFFGYIVSSFLHMIKGFRRR